MKQKIKLYLSDRFYTFEFSGEKSDFKKLKKLGERVEKFYTPKANKIRISRNALPYPPAVCRECLRVFQSLLSRGYVDTICQDTKEIAEKCGFTVTPVGIGYRVEMRPERTGDEVER